MRTVRYTFEEIKRRESVVLPCKKCGIKRERVVSESSTVNPFNTNEDGSVKTREEVIQQVKQKLQAAVEKVKAEGIICRKCEAA